MIASVATSLIEKIESVHEQGRRIEHSQGMQAHAQKLVERAAEIRLLLACRSALRDRGCLVPSTSGLARLTGDTLREARLQIERDAREGANPRRILNPVFVALNRITTDLRTALHAAWGGYVNDCIPTLKDDLLEVLRKIPDLRPQVNRLEARLRDLRGRRDALPLIPEELAAFDSGVVEVKSLWHRLGGASLPAEVLLFLQRAGGGNAGLETLTPTVQDWLTENRLQNAFRIGIARDGLSPDVGR